ncbi:MAG: hypothetical protein JXP34_28255 [Planctomycetes bacterium]|nr:hypothetical protein [Planctomycetota bacterium]
MPTMDREKRRGGGFRLGSALACIVFLTAAGPARGQELEQAFAFGANPIQCFTYNEPDFEYTMVLQVSGDPMSIAYDSEKGYGYEIVNPNDASRNGWGIFGPIDDTPNTRGSLGDDCPEQLYDSFIGAKDFPTSCTVGPCEPYEGRGIVFRADIPNGTYRFVGAFGESENPHAHTIIIEDGGEGAAGDFSAEGGGGHVVLVQDFDQAQWDIGEVDTAELGQGVYARVGFDGLIPPEGDGIFPDPKFVDMDEFGAATDVDEASSPTLVVTQGYIRMHQLQAASNTGIGGTSDPNGGDAVILEIWRIDSCCPGLRGAERVGSDVKISWKNGDVTPTGVKVVRNGTTLADNASVDPPEYIDRNPAPGVYEYTLTFAAACPKPCEQTMTYNGCIAGLRAARTKDGVTLTWRNNLPYDGIAVTRNGSPLETLAGDATEYTDELDPLTHADFTYGVKPTNGACGETEITLTVYPQEDVSPWVSEDIGNTLAGGIERDADDAFRIFADGADIWGTADAFRFTYVEFGGDFSFVARLDGLEETNAWTKAGLMARATTDPGSPYAIMLATPEVNGSGVDFQWRDAAGASAANVTDGQTGAGSFVSPVFLKLVRIGDTFTGYWSQDGDVWTRHQNAQTIVMGPNILVGMAVSSHASGMTTTAEFAEVLLEELDACPSDVACSCDGAGGKVTLAWTNNYDYYRLRIYRTPAAGGTRARIASLVGSAETCDDTRIGTMPAGAYIYEVIPIFTTEEYEGCTAARCEVTWPCTGGFIRGDTDGNGIFTIGDGVQILERLFTGRTAFGSNCEKAADADDNGVLTIGDAVWMFNLLFTEGADPKPPYPTCGTDPTDDSLTCEGPVAACP